ncbi:hypothetical protein H0H93_014991 [Arthromyces matolae]|nr:hypothetical protein H0H93_014991 [Arthromyces matolae]
MNFCIHDVVEIEAGTLLVYSRSHCFVLKMPCTHGLDLIQEIEGKTFLPVTISAHICPLIPPSTSTLPVSAASSVSTPSNTSFSLSSIPDT